MIAEAAFLGMTNLLEKWGYDLGLGHGFYGHLLPPVGWNLKLDKRSIFKRRGRVQVEKFVVTYKP